MFNDQQESFVNLRSIWASRTQPILLFVGSGISVQAGFPTWSQLRCKLENRAVTYIEETCEEHKKLVQREKLKSIKKITDNWKAFQLIKELIGRTEFEAFIRTELDKKIDKIPTICETLWKLPHSGVLSLNLDSLLQQAFINAYGTKTLRNFVGIQCKDFTYVLSGTDLFLVNLHGKLENSSSWILTEKDLFNLHNDIGFKNFINSCFTTKRIVFIGLTIDDIAIGGLIQLLNDDGIKTLPHFCFLSKTREQEIEWAKNNNVRVIIYDEKNNHAELEASLLQILNYKVPEIISEPVKPTKTNYQNIDWHKIPPDELIKYPTEDVRYTLNMIASELLEKNDIVKYEQFILEYEECVHKSWFATTSPKNNLFMGYNLIKKMKSGAFGTVFNAVRPQDGNQFAIKILHYDELQNKNMLHSFRRGVRAMQILNERDVHGIVNYIATYELPAVIVMELINGLNLSEAVQRNQIIDWKDILNISKRIVEIVKRAHSVPERVLHRDIKPSNVMIKDDDREVVILDFDLSWHKGGSDVSVLPNNSISGYLAPELIERSKYSTRNAAVDSYGLGMTFYFLISKEEPTFRQPDNMKQWKVKLKEVASKHKCVTWKSIPNRYLRLVEMSTKIEQNLRWDITQIQNELERLISAYNNKNKWTELIVEELVCRSDYSERYFWNSDMVRAEIKSARCQLIISAIEQETKIEICFEWLSDSNKGGEFKQVKNHLDKLKSQFKSLGWFAETEKTYKAQTIMLKCSINKEAVQNDIDAHVRIINQVLR